MHPFYAIDYQTACIEAETARLYEDERRRYEEGLDTLGEVREDINQDLERALIDTDTHGF